MGVVPMSCSTSALRSTGRPRIVARVVCLSLRAWGCSPCTARGERGTTCGLCPCPAVRVPRAIGGGGGEEEEAQPIAARSGKLKEKRGSAMYPRAGQVESSWTA
eukprot:1160915-Pyramimonas_sp.AAC.1